MSGSGGVLSITAATARVEREVTVLLRRTLERTWAGVFGSGPVDRFTYPVLALLDEHGPQGLGALTHRMGVTKPTVSRHVARLAAAGLVSAGPDRDPRAVRLTLTPQGREQVALVRRARREVLERAMGGWPEADVAALADLLGRLNAAVTGLPRR